MKTITKILGIVMILGLVFGFMPARTASAGIVATETVYVLAPSWTAAGGGGVYSAYIGPPAYGYVSPGSTALFDGREAGIIKAGLTVDPVSGIYEDEGLFGFKPDVTIDAFAAGTVSYDVDTQAGVNPVWMTIEIDTGTVGDRSDNTTYQHVPTTNPLGWHIVDAAAGLWQKWDDINGTVTTPATALSAVVTAHTGLNVVRAYLRLGMGNSYNNGGTGTIAWVDQATLGGKTYDFQVIHDWYVSPAGNDSNLGTELLPFLTIQHAIDTAVAGDTIHILGTNVLAGNVNVNKDVTLSCDPAALIQVSGTGYRFSITGAGATIDGCSIEKTDKTTGQDIIWINASNVTISNNHIWGQWVIGDGEVSRAMVISGGLSGLLITGNEIFSLRQPGYVTGTTTGLVSNNYVHGTKGWVLEGGNLTFTGNTWAGNVGDIAILSSCPSIYYTDILALSTANNGAVVEDQRLLPAVLAVVYVDDSAAAGGNGTQALPLQTIAAGVARVISGGTVYVAAGTYNEKNIVINKSLTLLGDPGDAGPGPGINAPIVDGSSAYGDAFKIANGVSNVTIKGFEVRNYATLSGDFDGVGNAVSAWEGSTSNITIQDNYFHHLGYNGVLVGNDYSSNPSEWGDHTNWLIKANIIENFGYIGFELTNTSNSTIEDNEIHMATPYIGAIFASARRPESGLTVKNNLIDGTPSTAYPVIYMYAYDNDMLNPSLANVVITGNTINTVGTPFQIYMRNIGTGTVTNVKIEMNQLYSVKNLTNSTLDSSPNWWGSASGPVPSQMSGTQTYIPWCTNVACTTFGAPVVNITKSTYFSTIQAAINDPLTTNGDVISVAAGTYPEHITINKALTITGANKATTFIDGSGTGLVALITANNVTLSGFTVRNSGSNPLTDAGIGLIGANTSTINGNIVTNNANGIAVMSSTGNTFSNNTISNNLAYGIVLEKYGALPGYSTGNTITTNTINANGRDGIYVGENNNSNQILNNIITGTIGDTNFGSLEGNGIYLWKSAANIINGNTISGNNTYGIEMYGSKNNTITHNIVTGNLDGLHIRNINEVAYPGYSIRGNNISLNQIYSNNRVNLYASPNFEFNIEANWWGSNVESQIVAKLASWDVSGNVVPGTTVFLDYSPWCAVPDCSILNPYILPPGVGLQAAIDAAPSYTTIIVPAGSYTDGGTIGYHIDTQNLTIILEDGVIIQNSSPCFTINADYTTIKTESIGGAKCIPTSGSNGIDVTAPRVNITIEGIEFVGTAGTDGIHFAGGIFDTVLVDNWFHNLLGDGIEFTSTPTGTVNIEGNLFQSNTELGINSPGTVKAIYNSWGNLGGASAGDGASAGVLTSPFTHMDLYMTSSVSPWANQVVSGQTITYTVKANVWNANAADFVLKYPANLTYVSSSASGTFGSSETLTHDGVARSLHFVGYSITGNLTPANPVNLFTVTFTAGATGAVTPMNLDELTDGFGMVGYESSSNIYAAALVDGSVTVIALPVMDIVPTAPYIAGLPIPFTLNITNTNGGAYTALNLNFTSPAGTLLEYYNGATWVTVSNPFNLGALTAGGTLAPLFRVTFTTPGSNTLSVNLVDTLSNPANQLLATASEIFTVSGNFTIKGTFSMQGRAFRGGLPVTLTRTVALYGPYSASTINVISQNLTILNVNGGTYTITTTQPRYLNVTAANLKTIFVDGPKTMTPLELKGGNAVWTNDKVDIADASLVGTQYGWIGTTYDGDVNFDGRVNIQDLALVGGNFDLTSEVAYGIGNVAAWVPVP